MKVRSPTFDDDGKGDDDGCSPKTITAIISNPNRRTCARTTPLLLLYGLVAVSLIQIFLPRDVRVMQSLMGRNKNRAVLVSPSSSSPPTAAPRPLLEDLTALFPVRRLAMGIHSNHNNETNENRTHSLQFYVADTQTKEEIDSRGTRTGLMTRRHNENDNYNNQTTIRMAQNKPIMAILTATRSKREWTSAAKSPLQHLIRSISLSVTPSEVQQWDIRLMVAIDEDDEFWLDKDDGDQELLFGSRSGKALPNRSSDNDRIRVDSPHDQLAKLQVPAWLTLIAGVYPRIPNHIPFNEIALAAYEMNSEYYCRVNDDSTFNTTAWISRAVHVLQEEFDPPNVGVVGPSCLEGNTGILTHDMTHRTHMEIFQGQYYPPQFHNWFLDDWITIVYREKVLGLDRSRKLTPEEWRVRHPTAPSRYTPNLDDQYLLPAALAAGRNQILHYLRQHHPNHNTTTVVAAKNAAAAEEAAAKTAAAEDGPSGLSKRLLL